MPRQRIYHTDEERAAANRAKGLRSYHRNSVQICARRREVYAQQTRQEPEHVNWEGTGLSRSNKGRKWTDELDDYHARFVRLSRPSPQQSLEQLYSKLIKAYSTGGLKLLEQQIQSFEALHQELRELENKILRSFGCGKELQIWQAVAKPVLRMLHCLQDIWCTYMGGLDDLKSVHKSNGFLYQK